MTSREDRLRATDKTVKRLSKTTGASKGTKPAPPAKVKVKPSLSTPRVTWEKKF